MTALSSIAAMAFSLAVPAAGFAAEPAAAPLAPSGKWVVEGQDNMCALSHAYGEGPARVTLAIRPWPIGDRIDILLFQTSNDPDPDEGTGQIELEPSGRKANGVYTSYAIKGRSQRLASLNLLATSRDDLASAATIGVTIGKKKPVVVAQAGARAAFAALANCDAMLLKSLNVDTAAMQAVASPATPLENQAGWFRPSDYPRSALSGGAQGATSMLVTIGIDGRIAACVPFGRSGNLAIDEAACAAFIRRGRFNPAIGRDGKPTVFYDTLRVNWVLRG